MEQYIPLIASMQPVQYLENNIILLAIIPSGNEKLLSYAVNECYARNSFVFLSQIHVFCVLKECDIYS